MITTKAILIEREIMTDGHSPLLVADTNYDKYIAKNGKGHDPILSLINEWLCYAFLKKWNIPTPDAALVEIPKDLLQGRSFSNHHRLHFYEYVTFGSKFIDQAIEVNEFVYSRAKLNYRGISNPRDFLHVALFDTWIENDDRKPANHNLLLQPNGAKFKIIAIDHAFVLSTLDYLDLNPDEFHPISNEHILVSELGHSIKRSIGIDEAFLLNEKDYFYLCIKLCEDIYDTLVLEITDVFPLSNDRVTSLRRFLFNKERNEKVFNEYLYRLKQ